MYLRFECNFTHGVVEAPNFEFADLKRITECEALISVTGLEYLQVWKLTRSDFDDSKKD